MLASQNIKERPFLTTCASQIMRSPLAPLRKRVSKFVVATYDVHRFAQGRPLILGGVTIPHTHGLDGHSDADVLCHAIADALLGAMGLPDIGHYFPPTDPSCEGISSRCEPPQSQSPLPAVF